MWNTLSQKTKLSLELITKTKNSFIINNSHIGHTKAADILSQMSVHFTLK